MSFESRHISRILNSIVPKITHTLLAIAISVGVSGGCRSDEQHLDALARARSMFREVLHNFEVQHQNTKLELEEGKKALLSFKESIRAAQDKDAEFAKVYAKWKRAESAVKQLHEKFAHLVRGADAYYAEMDARANSITDSQLKTKTLNSLKESKDNYTIRLKQTRNKINVLDDVNTKVHDTMTALEINYSLDVIEEKLTETFKEIDTMIESVMKDLEELLRESQSLLTIRFG